MAILVLSLFIILTALRIQVAQVSHMSCVSYDFFSRKYTVNESKVSFKSVL